MQSSHNSDISIQYTGIASVTSMCCTATPAPSLGLSCSLGPQYSFLLLLEMPAQTSPPQKGSHQKPAFHVTMLTKQKHTSFSNYLSYLLTAIQVL